MLFGLGYYAAALNNATDPSLLPPNTSLIPSKLALHNQKSNQPAYGSPDDYKKAIEELKARWGKKEGKGERVSTDAEDLETHGVSDWSYHEEKRPSVVVWVESTEEVQEVVLVALKYRVPITPFSGGTSLEGHFSSVGNLPISR
jgi:D-lactate dehydrogenase (cytochrome)